MLNKRLLTLLTLVVCSLLLLPCSSGWGRAGRSQGFRTGQVSGWHQGLLCSQGPARPWSQAHSDSSEANGLPFSEVPASLSIVSHNYTMQDFALKYFRKPQTL